MKRLVVDVDDTISFAENGQYSRAIPDHEVIKKLREYRALGFTIVLYTARNMRTHACNIAKINATTVPTLIKWLDEHSVPYDEISVGKPWCGGEGFYVDDKAVRPDEFKRLSYKQIMDLLRL